MGLGKWIGGGLGWAFGGPIGAIAGFALGSFLDNANSPGIEEAFQKATAQTGQSYNTRPGDFGMSLVVLSAAVMKADNRIMRSELDFVKSYLVTQFGNAQAKELVASLREVLKQEVPVRQVCLQIRSNMSHAMRLQLLHYLFGVAHADQQADAKEVHLLNTIARYLGISQKDFYSIHAMFGGAGRPANHSPNLSDSYRILEIPSTASDADLKKAYRKMAKKYHPDKVAALGPEFQTAAKEKFQKVQQAYEVIKKTRGIN